ncbi:hypothetical protein [Candidatus Nitrosocosmicus hydrocola]|uniref:hypothetical protein n=1 Tax=Candidatus Nitrosocosmicus hydrocola TaxID=1826872 RepID=UPI0011E5A110|nr:hypothetical protein [Candidatus Nitrosocosmicus hydrocola]
MNVFDNQEYSQILYITTSIFIVALGISGLNYSYSQPMLPMPSNNQFNQPGTDPSLVNTPNQSDGVSVHQSDGVSVHQSINWNQSLILDPTNVFCDTAGECGGIVEVAFESNTTIVLESYNSYKIFKVVDMIKNFSGYEIDDVSTTPQDGGIKYLVVMSN